MTLGDLKKLINEELPRTFNDDFPITFSGEGDPLIFELVTTSRIHFHNSGEKQPGSEECFQIYVRLI